MPKVISVGAITVDVTSFSDRLPRPGETLLGTAFTLIPGGKGANQAVAAARAGAPTAMVGCVGDDHFASLALANLHAEHIDTSGVEQVSGMTGVAHIRVDASAENDIVVIPLANAELTAELVRQRLAPMLESDDVVLVQLEVPREASLAAIELGKQRNARVILDPAPGVPDLAPEVWSGLFAVTPNESEASIITGIEVSDVASATAAAGWFQARGVAVTVITLAQRGAVVMDAAGARLVEAFAVDPVDTTAAGDAFTGYFAAALAEGRGVDEALRRATAAGALAVTITGASSSLPQVAAVEEFLP